MFAVALVMMVSVKSVAFAKGETLYIKGEEIKNPTTTDAVDTDKQWFYSHKDKTLVLNNFSYTNGTENGISVNGMDLKIELQGTNTIDTTAKEGIFTTNSSITILGTGSLSCTGSEAGIKCLSGYNEDGEECGGQLSINDVEVKAMSRDGGSTWNEYGMKADSNIFIENAKVTAIGGTSSAAASTYGIYNYGAQILIDNSDVVVAAGEVTNIQGSMALDTSTLTIDENSKAVFSGYSVAISNSVTVKNDIAGIGWTDVNGTEGATPITKSPGQTISYELKKIQFPVPEAKISKRPTVKNLIFTGTAQELINAGSATGGVMKYAIGTSATAFPPEAAFKTEIPVGIDAGEYYVWYMLVANYGYSSSTTPECLTVKIAEKDYIVTVTNDGNGTASASMAKGTKRTEVTLTATPNSGYHFKEWQVVKGGVTVSGNKFTIGSADVEIKAVFEKDQKIEEKPAQSAASQSEQQKPSEQPTEQAQSSQDADQIHTAPETAEAQPAETVDKKQKGTTISKVKVAGKKKITVTWKKQTAKGIKGYEIQYSTDKKFKKDVKTVTVNKAKTTSKTIKKLTPKKKYYLRIRTFKKSGKQKIYSKWSKAKNVKVK